MEAFCNETIMDIKAAKDESELIHVINTSMFRFRKERNSFNEAGFIMNMLVSLRTEKMSELSTGSLENIKLAIAIFRQMQRTARERIF